MNPPANWYPDPTGRHGQRYWDGSQWTEHVFTDGIQSVDPLGTGAAASREEGVAASTGGSVGQAADVADVEEAADAAEPAPLPRRERRGSAETVGTGVDEPITGAEGLFAPMGDGTGAAEPTTPAADTPDDAGDTDAWTPDRAAVAEDAEVAPQVEPDDVVASVEETTTPSTTDFSDAFVLAPETASRLVSRAGHAEDEDGPAPDAQEPPPSDEDAAAPIDAPPPTTSAPTGTGDLGISGRLVGGAFAERDDDGPVGLQNSRMLRCAAGGGVIARQGTMVAYQGDVSFERQGAGGVGRALKRAATGEGLAMMRVTGSGDVFFADHGQHVFLLELDGGPGLSVNGRNILAFSASLRWDIERVKGASLIAGGLFNTTLSGHGWVALVSDGQPVVLRTDEAPTYVDVNALVAWSGGLSTRVTNTVSAKSLVGLGSGEAFQMAFDGVGIVIVQPSEGASVGAAT